MAIEISPQLCHADYDPKKIKYPSLVEPKLDGVRALCIQGKFYSRLGKPLRNLESLEDYFASMQDFVYDGELLGTDWNETVGSVHTHYKTGAKIVYHVFDVIPLHEWCAGISMEVQARRTQRVHQLPPNELIHPVEFQIVRCESEIDRAYGEYLKQGYEGAVIKNALVGYMYRRHRAWTKIKPSRTEDFEIVSIIEGTGKYEKMMGALQVTVGNQLCGVGTGFTDQQRTDMWKKPPIGQIVEVRYQEKTKDGVLRFPSFVRIRTDLRKGSLTGLSRASEGR